MRLVDGEMGAERPSLSPLSRGLVPYAFGAAVLCAAIFVALVPSRGVEFAFPRYVGMLVAALALAGVASCLWSTAESAEQFARARGDEGPAAVESVRRQFSWVGLAAALCVYGAVVTISNVTQWFGPALAAAIVATGPLVFCAAWSVAIWSVGPGSPEPIAPVEKPLSRLDLAARAIGARAREAMQRIGLQRKNVAIVAIVAAAMWAGGIIYAFSTAKSGSFAYLIAIFPAVLLTNALWGFWDDVLAQRDTWSEERDLAYMRAGGALQTLDGLAGPALFIAMTLWVLRDVPACGIVGAIVSIAFAIYRVVKPVYFLRRVDVKVADG